MSGPPGYGKPIIFADLSNVMKRPLVFADRGLASFKDTFILPQGIKPSAFIPSLPTGNL